MSKVRAVNGFKVRRFNQDGRKGIFVIYLIDNEYFTRSKYYDVEDERIDKIKERLKDYTDTNMKAEQICQTIHLPTMINEVERIIFA